MIWLSASTKGDFERSISILCTILSYPEGETFVYKLFARFREWLRDPRSGEWLIILDGLDFAQGPLDGLRARHLLGSVPVSSRGATIVTMRENKNESELLRAVNTMRVHPLSDTEAAWFLELRLAEQSKAGDLYRLAKELGGLPLVLTQAAAVIRKSGMTLTEFLELLQLEKAKEADTTLGLGGHSADVVELTRRVAESERTKMYSATARSTDPSRAAKDSGYASRESGSIVQEDIEEQKETSDLQSIRTLSSFVDLGLDGRLRGINIFASDLAQSLSPDIPEVVEGRELVVIAVQDALRAYSYSLEQQNRPSKLSDERKAAHFIRQQSQ